jgi:hypothetical protein
MHGAGAAHADAAAELRAGEADGVADDPQQRCFILSLDRNGAAIDMQRSHVQGLRTIVFTVRQ